MLNAHFFVVIYITLVKMVYDFNARNKSKIVIIIVFKIIINVLL